jgi:hypothetical protein
MTIKDVVDGVIDRSILKRPVIVLPANEYRTFCRLINMPVEELSIGYRNARIRTDGTKEES